MLRKRTFELKSFCDQSSWENFDKMFQNLVLKKHEIEETFKVAAFDLNFNEPMNVIVLECDPRNPEVHKIEEFGMKIDDLFADQPDKLVVDVQIHEIPKKYRDKVFFTHQWFVKKPL